MTEGPDNTTGATILIVDDDASVRRLVQRWLQQVGYSTVLAKDGRDALDSLTRVIPATVLLDLNMPRVSGHEALVRIRQRHRHVPVVIITSDREVDTVVTSMQRGAYDYLTKPLDKPKLLTTVRNAVERHQMSVRLVQLQQRTDGAGYGGIVGRTVAMRELFRQMDRVAASDISVLIYGESGTGKELVATAIHKNSARRDRPFVALNCAAIPETLQESELFGHEKGAFTGATGTRIGKFEQAHTGTLFLDEVGELSPRLQAKLLRVLQERRFQRVGGSREIAADFRLLAATHRSLWDEVAAGRFREDLYFRIVVFELEIPPLCERVDDIPLLSQKFTQDFAVATHDGVPRIGSQAMSALMAYDWPGNVRELQNAIQRALVVSSGEYISVSDLPPSIRRAAEDGIGRRRRVASPAPRMPHELVAGAVDAMPTPVPHTISPLTSVQPSIAQPQHLPARTLSEVERETIESALERSSWNISKVCRELGIGRTTLYRKIKEYELR